MSKKKYFLIGLATIIFISTLVYYFIFPYKIVRVCFGDFCPANGGVYLLYKFPYSKEKCLKMGAYPVEGIGWSYVYAGCSPIDHQLKP